MSYIDERFAASFRGVAFATQGVATTLGRKTAIYRLPFESRGVAHLDLGRAPRQFKIEALIVESPTLNLRQQRDALIAALEAEGSGLLVHPLFGRVNVVVEDNITVTESTAEGGVIRIDFTCVEAREVATATAVPDAKAASITSARALRRAAGEAYEEGFELNVPDFVAETNLEVLDEVMRNLTKINAAIGSALNVPANFAAQIDRIALQTATLINTPQLLYNTIDATAASLAASVNSVTGRNRRGIGNLQDVTVSFGALGEDTVEPPDTDTPNRNAERNNRSLMLISLRASALGGVAEAAANATYTSANEAHEVLTTLVEQLTLLSDNAIDGLEPTVAVFDALRDLVAAITSHLESVAGSLAEVTVYTTADTASMLTIAYNLYGDATRFEELLDRNPQVIHPLLVPGRSELEVLTS